MANVKVCCANFFTDSMFSLLEWTNDQIEVCLRTSRNNIQCLGRDVC
jgi:hypothetical protein